MQWGRYNLFLILCLVLAYKAKLNPITQYPFGFYNGQLIEDLSPLLSYKLENWDQTSVKVLISYLLGIPLRGLKELSSTHSDLYLSHLLSPSAFHLISISWLLKFFFSKKVNFIFWFIIFILCYYLPPLHPALLRSIFLCLIVNSISSQISETHKISILMIALAIDYFWGSYSLMAVSYIFSFIILGNLLLLPKNLPMVIKLFIAQFHLAILFSLKIQLFHFIIGFLYGGIFLPIFTLIIIYIFLIPTYWQSYSSILEKIFNLYLLTMNNMANILKNYWMLSSTDNLLLLLFGLCFHQKTLKSQKIVIMALIIPQT